MRNMKDWPWGRLIAAFSVAGVVAAVVGVEPVRRAMFGPKGVVTEYGEAVQVPGGIKSTAAGASFTNSGSVPVNGVKFEFEREDRPPPKGVTLSPYYPSTEELDGHHLVVSLTTAVGAGDSVRATLAGDVEGVVSHTFSEVRKEEPAYAASSLAPSAQTIPSPPPIPTPAVLPPGMP